MRVKIEDKNFGTGKACLLKSLSMKEDNFGGTGGQAVGLLFA